MERWDLGKNKRNITVSELSFTKTPEITNLQEFNTSLSQRDLKVLNACAVRRLVQLSQIGIVTFLIRRNWFFRKQLSNAYSFTFRTLFSHETIFVKRRTASWTLNDPVKLKRKYDVISILAVFANESLGEAELTIFYVIQ